MGRYQVKETALQSHMEEMEKISQRLDRISEDVLSVRSTLAISNSSAEKLKSTLSRLATQTEEEKNSVNRMCTAAAVIAKQYSGTETGVRNRAAKHMLKGKGIEALGFTSNLMNFLGGRDGGGKSTDDSTGTEESGSGSWIHGGIAGAGSFLGFATSGEAFGDLFGYDTDGKSGASWNWTKGDVGAKAEKSVTGYIAKGTAKGSIGIIGGEITGAAIKGTAKAAAKATIMDDGKFAPSIGAEAKVGGDVLSGEAKIQAGSDKNNLHGAAEGKVLGGEAGVEAGAGKMSDGSYGVKGQAGAEIYAAKGKVKGGFSLFGIDVEVGVTGKAGAAGAVAGGEVTTKGVKANAGLSAILGVEGEISIDWSDFELPKFEMPKFNKWW